MLKRFYNWLRGVECQQTYVPVLHIRCTEPEQLSDKDMFEHCQKIMSLFPANVSGDEYHVYDTYQGYNINLSHQDLEFIGRSQQINPSHFILLVSDNATKLWPMYYNLMDLLLTCYGFESVTLIEYSTDKKEGLAAVYKLVDQVKHCVFRKNEFLFDIHSKEFLTGVLD